MANSASIWASGMQWKARSQAAYQGYSHLSGIEMMSALFRWRQSALRPCLRSGGGGGWSGSPSSHKRHVVVEELLAPDHAGERLALDAARVGILEPGLQGGIERIGLGLALLDDRVEVLERLVDAVPEPGAAASARWRAGPISRRSWTAALVPLPAWLSASPRPPIRCS